MAKGFDPAEMMQQARRMKEQISKAQEKLKDRVVEGEAGGGLVKAYVNCGKEVVGIKLKPDVVDPQDLSMLEDLIMVAVNNGLKRAAQIEEEEMNKLTGGMGLGGLL